MDTMKLLLGTIIALLVAAMVMSWNSMKKASSAEDIAVMKEAIASIIETQDRQAREREYVKNGTPPVAPPLETTAELEAAKQREEEYKAKLAALEAANTAKARDEKLGKEEGALMDVRDMEDRNAEIKKARLISNALLIAKVKEYVADEYGGVVTIEILLPEQVQQDTILAIRRNKTGILGQLKVTQIEGSEAVASPMPGFGPIAPAPGDELIFPPRF